MTVGDLKKILNAVDDDYVVNSGVYKASVKINPSDKTVTILP